MHLPLLDRKQKNHERPPKSFVVQRDFLGVDDAEPDAVAFHGCAATAVLSKDVFFIFENWGERNRILIKGNRFDALTFP